MATLVWDEPGKRTYQGGVDRGVLYIDDLVTAWNGLIKVEDSTPRRSLISYQDGIKYMEYSHLSEFEGSLTAFTYPDLFEKALGITSDEQGLNFHDQQPKPFNLSYRTYLGDDLRGLSRGYLIHILYNIYASPDNIGFSTLSSSASDPTQFSWKLTSVPIPFLGRRPTAHLSINSTKITSAILANLEEALYGYVDSAPYLPGLDDVVDAVKFPDRLLTVVDNGDGTWTANGSISDVKKISDSEFSINNPGAIIVDADTYTMPTT